MEEKNMQPDLGETFGEKKTAGKKKWLLAAGIVGLLAVIGIVAAAASVLLRSDEGKFVKALIGAYASRPEGTVSEEVFGAEELYQAYMEEPYGYGISLTLEEIVPDDLGFLKGGSLSLDFTSDQQALAAGGSMMAGYQGTGLLGIAFGIDREKMVFSIPGLTDRALIIDYSEGFEERLASSWLAGESGMTQEDIAELSDSLRTLREVLDSSQTDPDSWTELADRFWTAVDLASMLEDSIELERGGQQTFTVNGTETDCTGYQVTLRHEGFMEILKKCEQVILEDEQMSLLAYSYISQLELVYGDSTLAETGMDGLEDAINRLLEDVDQNTGDLFMTGYLDRSGDMAALTAEMDFTAGEESFHLQEEILFQGGSYQTENMEVTVYVAGTDGSSSRISLKQTGSGDGKQSEKGWEMTLDANEVRVLSGSLGMVYDRETNEASLTGQLLDETSYSAVTLEAAGVFDQIDKGEGFHFSIDQGSLQSAGGELDFTGELYMNPVEQVEMPDGEPFDIWTEDEAGWSELEMDFYEGIYLLGSQLGLFTY